MRTLTKDEINTIAGANGDPIRAVQNLPGVNRSNLDAAVIIEGSAPPEDTRFFVDGIDVPLSFHLFGNTSVIIPEAVDHVDYISAGFGAEFGRTTSGLVGLWTIQPRFDRMHGLAFFDLINAGAAFEAPVGKSSGIFISARKSYTDVFLRAFENNNAYFDLTPIPSYEDATIIFGSDLAPIDQLKGRGTELQRRVMSYLRDTPVDPANHKTWSIRIRQPVW